MRPLRELLVRNRDFRRLFLASVVSMAGDWFSYVAVAGLVTELTGRPGAPAFVYAATVLPGDVEPTLFEFPGDLYLSLLNAFGGQ